jgi:hypothetical protein
MVTSRLLNKTTTISIKDIYPNTKVLLQMSDGSIRLLDTSNTRYSEYHSTVSCYCQCHKGRYHFLYFKDISDTKIGKFLISNYKGLQSISILEESRQLVKF